MPEMTENPAEGVPSFRLDNERLAFRFTATLTDRHGSSIERLPSPDRLLAWLAANKIALGAAAATAEDLTLALLLREAIHRVGTSVSANTAPDQDDVALVNELARESDAYPVLRSDGLRWDTTAGDPVRAALGLVARDAVLILGGDERTHVKACESPPCRGLFVDSSRGLTRRWCSMSLCGNRVKKARFRGKTPMR